MPPKSKPPSGPLDRPACEKCGGRTMLARREPHPKLGLQFELRTFECQECGHKQQRTAGPDRE